jgi:hypothetical protein
MIMICCQGLVDADHRIRMCELAVMSSDWLMVDSWEALQPQHQRTLFVLQHIERELNVCKLVCSLIDFTTNILFQSMQPFQYNAPIEVCVCVCGVCVCNCGDKLFSDIEVTPDL